MQLRHVKTLHMIPAQTTATQRADLEVGSHGIVSLTELEGGFVEVETITRRYKLWPGNVAWAEPLQSSPPSPEVSSRMVDNEPPSPPQAAAPSGGLIQSGVAQAEEHNAVNVAVGGSSPSPGASESLEGPTKGRGNWRKGKR